MPKRKKPMPEVKEIEKPAPKPEPVLPREKDKCRVCSKELPDGHWLGRCVDHGPMWPTDKEGEDEHPKLP